VEGGDTISSVFDVVSCVGDRDHMLYVVSGVMLLSIDTYLWFSGYEHMYGD